MPKSSQRLISRGISKKVTGTTHSRIHNKRQLSIKGFVVYDIDMLDMRSDEANRQA